MIKHTAGTEVDTVRFQIGMNFNLISSDVTNM